VDACSCGLPGGKNSQAEPLGTLQLFSPFSHYREKSFPKTPVFPTLGKGSKLARSSGPGLRVSLGLRVSIRASITNRMVTSATTIEYRIRYNQVSSGHSAITALQLIKFQVYSCRQPRRRRPPVPNTKTTSSRSKCPAPVAENRVPTMVMVASRSVEMSGYDTDDESEEFSPSQYLKYRLEKSCYANNQTSNQMMSRIGLDIRILCQA